MSFRSFLVLLGMFCFLVSIWLGVQTFRGDPANAIGCFVLAVTGGCFIGISRAGDK